MGLFDSVSFSLSLEETILLLFLLFDDYIPDVTILFLGPVICFSFASISFILLLSSSISLLSLLSKKLFTFFYYCGLNGFYFDTGCTLSFRPCLISYGSSSLSSVSFFSSVSPSSPTFFMKNLGSLISSTLPVAILLLSYTLLSSRFNPTLDSELF